MEEKNNKKKKRKENSVRNNLKKEHHTVNMCEYVSVFLSRKMYFSSANKTFSMKCVC